jgi:cytochrome P450
VTLLAAGHETTATALTWVVQHVLAHPEVGRALDDELARGGSDYLDAVIRESLRLRPVIAAVARRLKAPMTVAGHSLPAGVTVMPCAYLAHRRAESFPEPERFRPERFLGKKPDPASWLPFGGGARRCLGMAFALFEMRVVLATLFARTRLRLPPEGPADISRRMITLAPAGGGRVVVEATRPTSGRT